MRRRTAAALAAALLALPLTACGDTNRGEANPDTAKPLPLASVNPTVFPVPSVAPSGEASASAGSTAPAVGASSAPAAGGGDAVTALAANKFDPAELSVKVGATVTWSNEGGFHTVTGGDGAADASSPIGNATLGDASATHTVTFDKAGTYPYFCQPHVSLGMKGTIVVT